ncbi:ATP-binding protein [Streptomyces sp. NPDC048331]|uniref:ATP-binding protein n=1 Tax=Streptomyces sp. NPDC048331 TaxID=3365534 RepID=UPI00371AFF12
MQAPHEARQTAERLMAVRSSSCPRGVAGDILLIVSELVTNAIRHANGPYALTFTLEDGRAGIAVSDGSAELHRHHGGRQRLEPGGRGLKIIRALGADLFVSPCAHGKQVIAVLTW